MRRAKQRHVRRPAVPGGGQAPPGPDQGPARQPPVFSWSVLFYALLMMKMVMMTLMLLLLMIHCCCSSQCADCCCCCCCFALPLNCRCSFAAAAAAVVVVVVVVVSGGFPQATHAVPCAKGFLRPVPAGFQHQHCRRADVSEGRLGFGLVAVRCGGRVLPDQGVPTTGRPAIEKCM